MPEVLRASPVSRVPLRAMWKRGGELRHHVFGSRSHSPSHFADYHGIRPVRLDLSEVDCAGSGSAAEQEDEPVEARAGINRSLRRLSSVFCGRCEAENESDASLVRMVSGRRCDRVQPSDDAAC